MQTMSLRLFDHVDLRVRSLAEAKPFYAALLPALDFPAFGVRSLGIAYDAVRDHPKPEFVGLIEDPSHVPRMFQNTLCAAVRSCRGTLP